MRYVLASLCLGVLVHVIWWIRFQNRERDDLRPVQSWHDQRMADLANEPRSSEEEVIFQRLNFEYSPRNQPPDEIEVQLHQHQDSLPNCDSKQWQKDAAGAGRCPYRTETRYPILVWWTPVTYNKHLIRRCTHGRCVFTHNRRELESPRTRAVLFDGSHLNNTDLPLPRKDSIEWILMHAGAPHLAPLLYSSLAMSVFNLTATFSRYSSYPLTLQHLSDIETLRRKQPIVSLTEKNAAVKAGGALLAYKASECDVPSDRDNLVRLLMDLITIDFFGECPRISTTKPPHGRRIEVGGWDEANSLATYKFMLVFETDLCADYISSTLWQALSYGVVPVYLGDADRLASLLPHPKAVILVSDFQSLPALVQYLKKLDANDDLYRKHLSTAKRGKLSKELEELFSRRTYGLTGSPLQEPVDGFECFSCDQVYEQLLAKAYSKPVIRRVANESHFSCHEPQPYSRSSSYAWQQRWQEGRKKGDELYRAVQAGRARSGLKQ